MFYLRPPFYFRDVRITLIQSTAGTAAEVAALEMVGREAERGAEGKAVAVRGVEAAVYS